MDGEGSVNKYVKAADVALTQAFRESFGVFMETLKVCILLDLSILVMMIMMKMMMIMVIANLL